MLKKWAKFLILPALTFNLVFPQVISADWSSYNFTFQRDSVVPYNFPLPPKILWTSQNLGRVDPGPSVDSDGNIYVSTSNGLTMLDKNGNKKWNFISNSGSAAGGSPVLNKDGNIYFAQSLSGNCTSIVYSIDKTGKQRWVNSLAPSNSSGQSCFSGALAVSPDGQTLYDGMLYPSADLVALNLDGTIKWKSPPLADYQQPWITPAVGNDGTIYIGTRGYGAVYAFTNTGAVKWGSLTDGVSGGVPSIPVVGPDGLVYEVNSLGGNGIYSYNNFGNRKVVYQNSGVQFYTAPTVANGFVYITLSKSLLAINLSDGSLAWQWSPPDSSYINQDSPVVDKDGSVYITTYSTSSNGDVVYNLSDNGQINWSLKVPDRINSLVLSDNNVIYLTQSVDSSHGYVIALGQAGPTPFLDLPFGYKGMSFTDAALAINSYFDHEYPILSAGLVVPEPASVADSVIPYSGGESKKLEYSSHDGYDYGLPAGVKLGDPVYAAADGIATFVGWCGSCGNMIEIDHGNGYQTRYMHMLPDGLIVNKAGVKVAVTQGEQIGKVGATGNATGPHIHFMVVQDKNHDGNFEDNIPDGVTDPLGWQSTDPDPWPLYSFSEGGVARTGDVSYYLYKTPLANLNFTLPSNGGIFQMEKYTLNFPSGTTNQNLNVSAKPIPAPKISDVIVGVGTALVVSALDGYGNLVHQFQALFTLTVDFSQYDISPFKSGSLSFYSSEDGVNWMREPTTIDMDKKIATTQVNHMSYFALMGERADVVAPTTMVSLEGTQGQTNWFRSDVNVILNSQDNQGGSGVDFTMVKINDGDWQPYTQPLNFSDEGYYSIQYYSGDKDGNDENPETVSFDIDKTIPEAKISVDSLKGLIDVSGVDKNQTSVSKIQKKGKGGKKIYYTVSDLAGNSVTLDVDDYEGKLLDGFKINTISYNLSKPVKLADNRLLAFYVMKDKKLQLKKQSLRIAKVISETVDYNIKLNKSNINMSWPKKKPTTQTVAGQVLLQVLTDQGKLDFSYQ